LISRALTNLCDYLVMLYYSIGQTHDFYCSPVNLPEGKTFCFIGENFIIYILPVSNSSIGVIPLGSEIDNLQLR